MAYTAGPYTYNAEQIIGDTMLIEITLQDEDAVAYDLTGASGVASIQTEAGVEVLAPTVTITSAADGQFTIGASAAATAALTAGNYRYACRITFADATVRTVIEGAMVLREVPL